MTFKSIIQWHQNWTLDCENNSPGMIVVLSFWAIRKRRAIFIATVHISDSSVYSNTFSSTCICSFPYQANSSFRTIWHLSSIQPGSAPGLTLRTRALPQIFAHFATICDSWAFCNMTTHILGTVPCLHLNYVSMTLFPHSQQKQSNSQYDRSRFQFWTMFCLSIFPVNFFQKDQQKQSKFQNDLLASQFWRMFLLFFWFRAFLSKP